MHLLHSSPHPPPHKPFFHRAHVTEHINYQKHCIKDLWGHLQCSWKSESRLTPTTTSQANVKRKSFSFNLKVANPQIKILSSFTHPCVVPNLTFFLPPTTKETFQRAHWRFFSMQQQIMETGAFRLKKEVVHMTTYNTMIINEPTEPNICPSFIWWYNRADDVDAVPHKIYILHESYKLLLWFISLLFFEAKKLYYIIFNVLFCVPQKKVCHTGLEQHETFLFYSWHVFLICTFFEYKISKKSLILWYRSYSLCVLRTVMDVCVAGHWLRIDVPSWSDKEGFLQLCVVVNGLLFWGRTLLMNEHRGVIFHLWLSALYRCSEMTCLTVRAVGVKQEPWKKNKVQSESVVFYFYFSNFFQQSKISLVT